MGLRNQSVEATMGQNLRCNSSGTLASPVCGDEIPLGEHLRGNLTPPPASQY